MKTAAAVTNHSSTAANYWLVSGTSSSADSTNQGLAILHDLMPDGAEQTRYYNAAWLFEGNWYYALNFLTSSSAADKTISLKLDWDFNMQNVTSLAEEAPKGYTVDITYTFDFSRVVKEAANG